jgi:HSP20 family protein
LRTRRGVAHAGRGPRPRRPEGTLGRQGITDRRDRRDGRTLFLGDTLDSDNLTASYEAGVLTLRIPIAEKAKPRKVEITTSEPRKEIKAA